MRKQNRQTQLEWREPKAMQWDDLPASVRERVREQLGVLLRRVAGQAAQPQEAPDEA